MFYKVQVLDSKGKISEGSDTKATEPMNRTDQISGSTSESTTP